MSLRHTLGEMLALDEQSFRHEIPSVLDAHGLDTDRLDTTVSSLPTVVDGPPFDGFESLSAHERELTWRLWVLDDVALGLTLAGPVYQDNPIIYANRTFGALTGYDRTDVYGENLRLLQGPDTEPDAVDALREGLDIWEPVTVELWNYRADGTRFRNRVSLVPLRDGDGMLSNWVGIQNRIEP